MLGNLKAYKLLSFQALIHGVFHRGPARDVIFSVVTLLLESCCSSFNMPSPRSEVCNSRVCKFLGTQPPPRSRSVKLGMARDES